MSLKSVHLLAPSTLQPAACAPKRWKQNYNKSITIETAVEGERAERVGEWLSERQIQFACDHGTWLSTQWPKSNGPNKPVMFVILNRKTSLRVRVSFEQVELYLDSRIFLSLRTIVDSFLGNENKMKIVGDPMWQLFLFLPDGILPFVNLRQFKFDDDISLTQRRRPRHRRHRPMTSTDTRTMPRECKIHMNAPIVWIASKSTKKSSREKTVPTHFVAEQWNVHLRYAMRTTKHTSGSIMVNLLRTMFCFVFIWIVRKIDKRSGLSGQSKLSVHEPLTRRTCSTASLISDLWTWNRICHKQQKKVHRFQEFFILFYIQNQFFQFLFPPSRKRSLD